MRRRTKSDTHEGVDPIDLIECPECDGGGETECECLECADVHWRRCDECDGTGKIKDPDCDNPDKNAAKRAARHEWEQVKLDATFKFTRESFRGAYRRMFGRDATEEDVEAWVANLVALAKAAGEEITIK